MDWIKKNWLHVFQVSALLIVIGFGIHLYNKVPDYAGKVEIAKPAPEVAKVPMVDVPVKIVKVYVGGVKLKEKLILPKLVIADDKQQVIASSKIEPSDNPHTVTTVINTDTGASETYVRTDPLPWLAYRSSGGVGVYYGLKGGEQAVRIQVRQDIIQIKSIRLNVIGSVDRTMATGQTSTFIGAGAEYRW